MRTPAFMLSVTAALLTSGCGGPLELPGDGGSDGGGRDGGGSGSDGGGSDGGGRDGDSGIFDAARDAPGSTGDPLPLGAPGSWTLRFDDEFNGDSLDLSKWKPNWFGSTDTSVTRPINDLEVSCYDPAQVSVSGGTLKLVAASTTNPACLTKSGARADYASGLVMSDGHYNFTYGFIEARIWLPPGPGLTPQNWAAFWTDGNDWPVDGEIDVMETLGGGSSTVWHYHYDSDTGSGVTSAQIGATASTLVADGGWHVFAADWEPELITFYYDGVAVGSVASSGLSGGARVTSSPQYVILNLGLNGAYAVHVPATMEVDYVRHWQH